MAEIRFLVLIVACVLNSSYAGLSLAPHRGAIQSRLLNSGVECLKDYPLTKDQINAFKAKKLNDDQGSKCFAACLFKNFGIIDEHGVVSVTGAQRSAKKVFKNQEEYVTKAGEIVDTCSIVNEMKVMEDVSDHSCEKAKFLFECLVENGPKLGFDLKF